MHAENCFNIWCVVKVLNNFNAFLISYPLLHVEQKQIAAVFDAPCSARLQAFARAIDGVLTWINKPSEDNVDESVLGRGK